ncbi:hypothetical protein Rctr197k_195 [Virus Rctr197k]|nr:hypothetical protein Rctr197k_195 [Virus Rctr197k]
MKRLQVLCPQSYEGVTMKVVPCRRCHNWAGTHCVVETGCEHLPEVPQNEVPTCPIQDRCQHQIQAGDSPCVVRARGMVCESALVMDGMTEDQAMMAEVGFSAITVCPPEEWEAREARLDDEVVG